MKLNWAERWVVNNPVRVLQQRIEVAWMRKAIGEDRWMPQRLLEVGAGRGAAVPLILHHFVPELLVTTDLDPAMLVRAHGHLRIEDHARANLCAADSLFLPFRDVTMDGVFGFGVIHHVPNWRAALAEIARVLKPRGFYFLEELYPALYQNAVTKRILLHPAEDRFRSRDIRDALASLGFRTVALREIHFIGVLAVLQKK